MTPPPPLPPSVDATPLPPNAELCGAARHVLGFLFGLFGGPSAIVALGVVTPAERREILDWLRPIETLLRLLLLAEAAGLARTLTPTAPRGSRAARRPAACRSAARAVQDADACETWRVSFRACSPEPRTVRPARADRLAAVAEPRRAHRDADASIPDPSNPWPLAERIEAVVRVLETPAPYVRRLARRLAAARGRAAALGARLGRAPSSDSGGRRRRRRPRGPADTAIAEARDLVAQAIDSG